ncbi:Signal transduction histidine kinase [Loktanella fryxellensis]|uniref:histidine kinase n=1 Tax=Loktanella fryxellensis TaxID=245187 RepID=A0A1H8GQR4_9RHOB|nr:HAMP domain-containing sensor histidine kinase [Loktanella fryxellensis]SEN46343.1 Signal transduction histidine kinase [Loktanella fryxellensis]
MRRLGPASLLSRIVAVSAIGIGVALLAAWMTIGAVLDRFVVARVAAELDATSDALLAGLGLGVGGDGLALAALPVDPRFSRPLSGWFWQITTPDAAPLVSESLFLDTLPAPYRSGPDGAALVVRDRSVTIPGWDDPIAIVVTAPMTEVAAAQARVRAPLLTALVALGVGLVALAAALGLMALSGFRHIGAGIAAIRAGRSERLPRRGLSEVDAPVDEINSLLDQNRAVMTRAREHVGNLAHALKTPLAALLNDAPAASDAARLATRMDRLIRYHLRRARGAGAAQILGARTPVLDVAEDIAMVLRGAARARGVALRLDVDEMLDFAGEREDLEEIIGNLCENAVQWARSAVDLTAVADGAALVVTIADDGPGIGAAHLPHALQRGGRLDEGVAGSGLGLGIVTDLVGLNAGEIAFAQSAAGGLRVDVRLPRAVPQD